MGTHLYSLKSNLQKNIFKIDPPAEKYRKVCPNMDLGSLISASPASRYDRQIRLWGDTGQDSIQQANILIIGKNIASLECAKSLILAGVGNISILEKKTEDQPKFSGFFNKLEDLQLLNPDVNIEILKLQNQIYQDIEFLKKFKLIILAESDISLVEEICKVCYQTLKIPCLLVCNFGQIGFLRVNLPERGHVVLNSHSEFSLPDMRLELLGNALLKNFSQELQISKTSLTHLEKLPFPILIYKIWQKMLTEPSDEKIPDKTTLKSKLKELSSDPNWLITENYTQAVKNVNKYVQKYRIPVNCRNAIEGMHKMEINCTEDEVLVYSLKLYVEKYTTLPISSKIDDMASSTENYIKLQNIYKSAATSDLKKFIALLPNLNKNASIPPQKVEQFCKNASEIAIVKNTIPFHVEIQKKITFSEIQKMIENDSYNLKIWWLIYMKYILKSSNIEFDLGALPKNIEIALNEYNRLENLEFHPVATIIGNITAQETIKLITKQYIPLNGTLIYDGISEISAIYSDVSSI